MNKQDQSIPPAVIEEALWELFGKRAHFPTWLEMLKAQEFYGFLLGSYPAPKPADGIYGCLDLLLKRKHESTNARLSPEQYERAVLERYVFWRRTTYMNALRRAMDDANTESNRIDRWLCGRTYSD